MKEMKKRVEEQKNRKMEEWKGHKNGDNIRMKKTEEWKEQKNNLSRITYPRDESID